MDAIAGRQTPFLCSLCSISRRAPGTRLSTVALDPPLAGTAVTLSRPVKPVPGPRGRGVAQCSGGRSA